MKGLGMPENGELVLAVNRLKSLQKLYLFEQKGGENYLGWAEKLHPVQDTWAVMSAEELKAKTCESINIVATLMLSWRDSGFGGVLLEVHPLLINARGCRGIFLKIYELVDYY